VAPSGLRGCAGNCVDDGSGGDVEPVGDEVPGAHAMGAASSACTCGGGGKVVGMGWRWQHVFKLQRRAQRWYQATRGPGVR
jgi:hypothetical protein